MTNSNFEPRLTQAEQNIEGLQAAVSELRSTVSTLADLIQIQAEESATDRAENNRRFEESRQRFDRFVEQAEQDRALMLQLIQTIAQGRNGEGK